ncbi:Os11g0549680, partial [Oryza sativa Japonica Group]
NYASLLGYFNLCSFGVFYEARSNTRINRMKIINAVSKSVPQPHKVDLNSPNRIIIVQIEKIICMVGVIERYTVLAKFNLKQLTSPPQKQLMGQLELDSAAVSCWLSRGSHC